MHHTTKTDKQLLADASASGLVVSNKMVVGGIRNLEKFVQIIEARLTAKTKEPSELNLGSRG